jgi:PTS system N-acetylgalactosamine-specific IIA component
MTSSPAAGAAVRRAVVAGHGDFAAGMISAVQQISGKGDLFRGVSNRDLSAGSLEEALRATLHATASKVIFTDLPAGSCTIAARRIARDEPDVVVVSGANLSVLLAWAFAPDDGAVACEHAVQRGRNAIGVVPGAPVMEGGGAH